MVDNFDVNITIACKYVGLSKSTYYYQAKIKDDSEIINTLNSLVDKHPRNGFWLLFNRIRKLGYSWNHKKVYRVYKALGLNIKKN